MVFLISQKPEEQRLIYQGKLLRDEEVFQDFLRDLDQEKHTLHLVYKLKRTPSAEVQERQTAPVVQFVMFRTMAHYLCVLIVNSRLTLQAPAIVKA